MYALALVAGLSALVFWRDLQTDATLRTLGRWVVVGVGAGTIGFVLLFTPLVYGWNWVQRLAGLPVVGGPIREVLGAMAVYWGRRCVIALTVAMSVLGHVGFVLSLWCAAAALPGELWPFRVHYLVAPIGLSINAIPLSPGGIGVGEAAMQSLFQLVGGDGPKAFLMMLAYRALCWLIALIGVPYFIAGFSETRQAIAASRLQARRVQDTE
jgi:hypothetical protein